MSTCTPKTIEPLQTFNLSNALSNNIPLTDGQHAEVQKILTQADRDLWLLDVEITRVEVLLADLRMRRRQSADQMDQHRIVIAPHRKLPTEILANIFVHCSADGVDLPSHHDTGPWVLGQVCARWRRVALSVHHLWNRVRLDYQDWSRNTALSSLAVQYLSRSGPLLIELEIRGQDVGLVETPSNPIADLVIPHAHRLKTIHIDAYDSWLKPFFELPAGLVASLEAVSLHVFGNTRSSDVVTVFEKATKLRQVTLRFNTPLTTYRLPWTRLTDLHLPCASINPDLALVLLRYCTNLVNCAIQLGPGDVASQALPTLTPLITLDKVKQFEIDVDHCDNFSQFLRRLVLPTLTDFHLLANSRTQGWEPAFVPLITRSCCLVALSISLVVPAQNIHQTLKELPLLTALRLDRGEPFAASTLDMMSRGELVPRLRTIKCVVEALGLFVSMLENRWAGTDCVVPCAELDTILITLRGSQMRDWDSWRAENWGSLDRITRLHLEGRNILLNTAGA